MEKTQYRGWDKRRCKFIYDDFAITSSGSPFMIHENNELNRYINEYYQKKGDDMWGDYGVLDFTDWYAISDVNIMMSTQNKDKNGRLIYESDFVEFMGRFYTVCLKRGCFLLENEKEEIWWHQLNTMDIESSMQIIGNIYEQRKTKLNVIKKLI